MGKSESKNLFKDMENLCGKKPTSVLELTKKEVDGEEYIQKVKGFADGI